MKAACEGGKVYVVGIGNIHVRQMINGIENIIMLKDVGFAPKCRTNLVAMVKVQRAGVSINFEGGGIKFTATHKGKVVMICDSRVTEITELTDMVPVRKGKSAVPFFTAGEDDSMQLAHRRTCHTAVSRLRKMESVNTVHGLEATKSVKPTGKIYDACVEGKTTNQPHHRREKSAKGPLQ